MTGSNRRLLRDLFAAPLGFHNAPPFERPDQRRTGSFGFLLVSVWASYMPVMIPGNWVFFQKNA